MTNNSSRSIAIALLFAAPAVSAFPITIDPGTYAGRYLVANQAGTPTYNSGFVFGQTVADLPSGAYFVDDGTMIGGSAFAFSVDASGTVTSISNPAAATSTGAGMVFNSQPITIDPGAYTGGYFLSALGNDRQQNGALTVNLVPGLSYGIDSGSFTGSSSASSSFQFQVTAAGTIGLVSPAAAAVGSGSTLQLQTVVVTIDPGTFTSGYYVAGYGRVSHPVAETFAFINDLLYGIDNGCFVGGSSVYFAAGHPEIVALPAASATVSADRVRLANVLVSVDTHGYTGPYLVGHDARAGNSTAVVIPALTSCLVSHDLEGTFVVSPPDITPPSVVVAGQAFSFSLASPQTISFAPLAPHIFGDAPFVVVATASSGLPVAFAASGSCTISGATVAITGAGTCSITATQPGGAQFNAATPVTQSFTIAKAGQTVALAPIAGARFGDPAFAVAATSTSALAPVLSGAGACTVSGSTVTLIGGGLCTVTATQPGNADYEAATAVSESFTVRCFPDQLPFAVRGRLGTIVIAQLSFVTQDPAPGAIGCAGSFKITIPQLPASLQNFASGTYAAGTAATVASANLSGMLLPPYWPVPFTGTLSLDVGTNKLATSATFPADPQDPALTVRASFSPVGGAYVLDAPPLVTRP